MSPLPQASRLHHPLRHQVGASIYFSLVFGVSPFWVLTAVVGPAHRRLLGIYVVLDSLHLLLGYAMYVDFTVLAVYRHTVNFLTEHLFYLVLDIPWFSVACHCYVTAISAIVPPPRTLTEEPSSLLAWKLGDQTP